MSCVNRSDDLYVPIALQSGIGRNGVDNTRRCLCLISLGIADENKHCFEGLSSTCATAKRKYAREIG